MTTKLTISETRLANMKALLIQIEDRISMLNDDDYALHAELEIHRRKQAGLVEQQELIVNDERLRAEMGLL